MKTIVGLYDDMATGNQVVQALVNDGLDRDRISLVKGDREGQYGANGNDNGYSGQTTDAGDATAGGAVTGAVVGGVGGALLSLSALAIPGIGPVVAAGPLIAGLIGAGAGAAVGGLLGALTEAGVPEEEAKYYAEGVNHGGTLVSVQAADDETDHVVKIMNGYNPIDVKERASSWRSEERPDYGDSLSTANKQTDRETASYTTQTMTSPPTTNATQQNYDRTSSPATKINDGEEARIPIVEEDVKIGKRQVERGGVRVRTSVEEQPFEEQVNLHEEQIKVERRPVNRPAAASDLNAFEDKEFQVSAKSEEAVVQKQARVVEEVVVKKDAHDRTETVRDTTRKTRVDVEQTGANGNNKTNYDATTFRNHYQTNYANTGHTYEQYEPAYRYGSTLANETRYRGRDWNTIEADVRRDWNQNHKDSAWEDFKDAVRYSWERTKDAVTR